MNQKKIETVVERIELDSKTIVDLEFIALDEPYFQLTLKFPNGSKRTLYISYKALESKDQKAAG